MKHITETFKLIVLTLLCVVVFSKSHANQVCNGDSSKIAPPTKRPVQLTFIPPLSSNGINAFKVSNNASINIIAGVNGGVHGVELSSLVGVNLGQVKGAQFAGCANINLKSTQAAQFAGLVNYSQDTVLGSQFGGLSNIALNNSKGAQVAGLTNLTVGELNGVQLAGLASLATKSSNTWQFSGLANAITGYTQGMQAAGIVNYSMGNKIGQLSGIVNANIGNLKGIQVSGIANFNSGKINGFQAAGILNFTRSLNGVQLGLFNYTDSIENGMVIGLLSIVRNGYRSFKISTSESLYGVFGFRTGTDNFYNILSVGSSARFSTLYWGFGYGVGTKIHFNNKADLNIEAISYHINEDEGFTNRINSLNKIQITASIPLGDVMKMTVGPSWNIFVNKITTNTDGNKAQSHFAPYSLFNKTYNNNINIRMYPGFSLGINF